ncbi:Endo-1,4-beta-xylanase A precursor [compost metagenome]
MELVARALAADGNPLERGGTLDAYPDAAGLTGSAKDSAAALVKHGILNGKGGKLAPNDLLTRAEAAVILYRIWKL